MKIALVGSGKTGGKVLELMSQKNMAYTVFNSTNPPTLEKIKGHDVIISFLTGEVFKESYRDLFLKSKIPVVTGSTGIAYTESDDHACKDHGVPWIYATNFSLAMNLVSEMIGVFKKAPLILSSYEIKIHEVHHTKKLDAPSGTALSFKKWSGHTASPITSERTGDVIGIHEITLSTPTEKISIRHEALDRKIFAEGALFAATLIHELKPGLHLFQDVIAAKLNNQVK